MGEMAKISGYTVYGIYCNCWSLIHADFNRGVVNCPVCKVVIYGDVIQTLELSITVKQHFKHEIYL